MTITAINATYDFRPFSKVPEDRAALRQKKAAQSPKEQLDLFEQKEGFPEINPEKGGVVFQQVKAQEHFSVSGLMDELFSQKIKRSDVDHDDRLNRAEYTGSDQQFSLLDKDDDGLISAADLKRESLAKNTKMWDMVEGFSSELYDRILNTHENQEAGLETKVDDFFATMVEAYSSPDQGSLKLQEFPGTAEEFAGVAGEDGETVNREEMVSRFREDNPDLTALKESLVQLKEEVAPDTARSHRVDVYA